MNDLQAARVPYDPVLQRYRDYARQRQMTLSDLLLENRIVFLGSSPETGGQSAITDFGTRYVTRKRFILFCSSWLLIGDREPRHKCSPGVFLH